jgi:anti-sigma regulatory factor (Ser/Thr protein kinase)
MKSNQLINKDEIQLAIPASSIHLHLFGACITTILERLDPPSGNEIFTHNVMLAVHETCVNIIEHAYLSMTGRINLVISLFSDPDRFVIDIYDTGKKFTLPEIQQTNLDELQINGYGLFLIDSMMDEVIYDPGTNQNHWHFEKLIS